MTKKTTKTTTTTKEAEAPPAVITEAPEARPTTAPSAIRAPSDGKNYRAYEALAASSKGSERLDHLIGELRQGVANGQHFEIPPQDAALIADLLQDMANG